MLVTHKVKNELWDMYIHSYVCTCCGHCDSFHTIAHDKNSNNKQQNCKNWYLVAYIEWLHKPVYKKTKNTLKSLIIMLSVPRSGGYN